MVLKHWRQTVHTMYGTTPHHNCFTALFRDHPGQPVPEENLWTLWCKGRLTEADTPTIRLGATPSGLTSAHLHHAPIFYRPDALPATQPTVSKHRRQHSVVLSLFDVSFSVPCSAVVVLWCPVAFRQTCSNWLLRKKCHYLYVSSVMLIPEKFSHFPFTGLFAIVIAGVLCDQINGVWCCFLICFFCICILLLWSPYVIGQTIIFLPCGFFLLLSSFFFSSPNLSGRRLDVYMSSFPHGVALVRI